MIELYYGDNLDILRTIKDESIDLIYIDPPFNTGKIQNRNRISVEKDSSGDRIGFGGNRYSSTNVSSMSFDDSFDDYIEFIADRIIEARRVLNDYGSIFVHLDYHEVHYCKVMMDKIFGRDCFHNEIIWAYDYGARSKTRWPTKHDNILWYSKTPSNYQFNSGECDRIPYMAPGLVGKDKAAVGKLPTDTWWHTIVTGREKTGYPTQKPRAIIDRIVKVHSSDGDRLLDFFAGSGTLGESAAELGRDVVLVDNNIQAIRVMLKRFANYDILCNFDIEGVMNGW